MTTDELRAEIPVQLEQGASMERVEGKIEAAQGTEDQKAALWLFAWSLQPRERQIHLAQGAMALARLERSP